MKGEALKGHLDVMLLALLGQAPAHGYAIVEGLRRRSGGAFDLPEGTIYPALHRLERAGLLRSRWQTRKGERRRRVYAITPAGRRAAGERHDAWRAFARAVDAVLGGTSHGTI
jgi:PadR family transcriptional regulator PadR